MPNSWGSSVGMHMDTMEIMATMGLIVNSNTTAITMLKADSKILILFFR